MKCKVIPYLVILCLWGVGLSCKKDANGPGSGNGGISLNVGGILYYDWADEGLLKINLATGIKSTVLSNDLDRHNWDMTHDGKRMLICSDTKDNDYDANLYTYQDVSKGTIIWQFRYYPTDGDITTPYISYDEKLIAVEPTYDDGLVILDLTGKVLHNLTSFMGKKIQTHICWMPDNTILFRVGSSLYRTNTAFTQASLVRALDFADWGGFSISVDGTKIAFHANNHIWMMDANGANLVQVTDSDQKEVFPLFSPDGKYLQIGGDYHTTGPFGHIWYLAIVPADGQKYNVNEGVDKRVMAVIEKGQVTPVASDGIIAWR